MASQITESDSEYIRYRGFRSMNREVFLLNHSQFVHGTDALLDGLGSLANGLRGKRDIKGRSFASFVPFLQLIRRQVLSAFDHLASYQPYQAWMMVRPAVVIPLIMGKWIDDTANKAVWMQREAYPQAYRCEYSGKKMQSASLPNSQQIQSVLSKLNDQFVHPNPFYYHRHLTLSRIDDSTISMEVDYFDTQEQIESHVLAFLHLTAVVHDSTREMLMNLVGNIDESSVIVSRVESTFGDRASELCKTDSVGQQVLHDLGLWPKLTP